jgi:hypothetical protein
MIGLTSGRYGSAFGDPVARVQGIGWVKELVARLTHTPIKEHNSSTNSTLDDDPVTFPLNQSLYVDATHEVIVLNSTFIPSITTQKACMLIILKNSNHCSQSH